MATRGIKSRRVGAEEEEMVSLLTEVGLDVLLASN